MVVGEKCGPQGLIKPFDLEEKNTYIAHTERTMSKTHKTFYSDTESASCNLSHVGMLEVRVASHT